MWSYFSCCITFLRCITAILCITDLLILYQSLSFVVIIFSVLVTSVETFLVTNCSLSFLHVVNDGAGATGDVIMPGACDNADDR